MIHLASLLVGFLASCAKAPPPHIPAHPDPEPALVPCEGGETPSAASGLSFTVDPQVFEDFVAPRGLNEDIIGVVSADMDLDGDPDLLVNRHLRHPLELWENEGGSFSRSNPAHDDPSGLYDNAGVPDLFSEGDPSTQDGARDGLYVWHDSCRDSKLWKLAVRGDAPVTVRVTVPQAGLGRVDPGDLRAECDANKPPARQESVSGPCGPRDASQDPPVGECLADDTRWLELTLQPGQAPVLLQGPAISTRLQVEQLGTEPLPMWLGGSRSLESSGHATLWLQDHHGAVWMDLMGGPEPDMYLSRGASMGTLHWPGPGKPDALFLGAGGLPALTQVAEGVVPANYCSTRQVSWVNVFGVEDGGAMSLSCEGQPNRLLRWQGGRLVDEAPRYGLAGCDAPVTDEGRDDSCRYLAFAWTDVEEDGSLEQLRSVGMSLEDGLSVQALGRDGPDGVFQPRAVPGLGELRGGSVEALTSSCRELLPATVEGSSEDADQESQDKPPHCALVPPVLQLVDLNRDGLLDLMASGYGLLALSGEGRPLGAFATSGVTILLKRRGPDGISYVDATPEGLDGRSLLAADLDSDGWMDLVSGQGGELKLLHNQRSQEGLRFDDAPVSFQGVPDLHTAALDLDGDCATDLIAVGAAPVRGPVTDPTQVALRNTSPRARSAWTLKQELPSGTLVRVTYADGGALAQQVGATQTSRYSQGSHPIHFGSAGAAPVALFAQRPGEASATQLWPADDLANPAD